MNCLNMEVFFFVSLTIIQFVQFFQEKLQRKELEMKSRLLKRKLDEEYKKGEKRRKHAIKRIHDKGKPLPSAVVVKSSPNFD